MQSRESFVLENNVISKNEEEINLDLYKQAIILNNSLFNDDMIDACLYKDGNKVSEFTLPLDEYYLIDFVQKSKDLYLLIFRGFNKKILTMIMNEINNRYLEYHSNVNSDKIIRMKKEKKRFFR